MAMAAEGGPLRSIIRALLRQQHGGTVFRSQPFADWKFDTQFDRLLRRPADMLGIVGQYRGRIAGAAFAVADQYMLSEGPPFVSVQVIAVELEALHAAMRAKTFLGLAAAVRQWAASLGASHTQICVTTGSNLKSTDRLLRAAGAKCVGGAYLL